MNCVHAQPGQAPLQQPDACARPPPWRSTGASTPRSSTRDVLPVSNGLFMPGSPYYSNDGYPAYNPSAKPSKLVAKVKAAGSRCPSPRLDQLAGRHQGQSSTSQQALQHGGHSRSRRTSSSRTTHHQHALAGNFQALTWRQFGAVDPDLNYIFWSTTTASLRVRCPSTWPATRDPTHRDRPAGRARPAPTRRPGAAYQTVNQRLAIGPPLPVERPGRLGRRSATRPCRTSTTRPRRRASRPTA